MLFGLFLPQHGQAGAIGQDYGVPFCMGFREQQSHPDGGLQMGQDFPSLEDVFVAGRSGAGHALEPGGRGKEFPVKIALQRTQGHFPYRHTAPGTAGERSLDFARDDRGSDLIGHLYGTVITVP